MSPCHENYRWLQTYPALISGKSTKEVFLLLFFFLPDPAAWGWDVAQFVRALDRPATDAGSIPWCGEGFPSQSQCSVQTLFLCPSWLAVPTVVLVLVACCCFVVIPKEKGCVITYL